MEFIGVIIFLIVSAIVSIAQKSAEKKKARERAERRAQSAQEPMAEHIPTARRKGAAPRPTAQQSQAPDIDDVIKRLMGVETEGLRADDEADWQPVPPPVRREIPRAYQQPPAQPARTGQPRAHRNPPPVPPRQMHEPQRQPLHEQQRPSQPSHTARPVRQRPARTPAELMGQQQQRRHTAEELTQEEIEQRERERLWRVEMERRKQQQAAEQAAQRPKDLPRQRPYILRPSRGLFRGPADVRRAIILSEVLAPPRALRNIEDRA